MTARSAVAPSDPAGIVALVHRDRRGGLRVERCLGVAYESIDALVHAYTEDLSRGGAFVHTDEFLPVGDVVRLSVAMPDGDTLTAYARVAHIIDASQAELPAVTGRAWVCNSSTWVARASPTTSRATSPRPATSTPCRRRRPAALRACWSSNSDDASRDRSAAVVAEAGHAVTTAKNGMAGLLDAVAQPPDVVVCEV